ncbi:unnamed protein product [Lactuca virosa]|uniref:ABC transporter domain-containing protein n=1 Tax=Lactuca virosa TaxID=75947 RepID=A0AAU9LMZ9_9ASTR|nr:unnamed protein product [Lactuca virosa]
MHFAVNYMTQTMLKYGADSLISDSTCLALLTPCYEDKVLLKKANISIERGDKVAIIGPNGCGKSTLLKLTMGLQKPNSGEVILGEHNVLPNYFEQNQVMLQALTCHPCPVDSRP